MGDISKPPVPAAPGGFSVPHGIPAGSTPPVAPKPALDRATFDRIRQRIRASAGLAGGPNEVLRLVIQDELNLAFPGHVGPELVQSVTDQFRNDPTLAALWASVSRDA